MKKLFQINSCVNFLSTGRIVEEIGITVMNQGWESYVAYGRESRPSQSKLIKIGSDLDEKIHFLKTRMFDRHGFGSKRATLELVKNIKQIKPDIIHLHNIHGYYINIEILFKYLAVANIPVVWTLHDCWPLTGHCAWFDFAGCNKWETGCFYCPQMKEYPSSLWLDNSKMNYIEKSRLFNSINNLTIVPVSRWLEDIVNKSFLKNFPLHVINNGVDINIFSPQESCEVVKKKLNVSDCFVLVGVAAVWESRKGLNDFIKISKLIDHNTRIVLVGLSKKQIKDLPPNIIGICRTDNIYKLVEIYSAADLFLNLTYEDNFPTTNIESLACGTPILTYNTGGSVEAVSQETGFIVEKGDLSGIMNVINIVKKNGKSSYSMACRDRAEKFYNKNDRYIEYIELYDHILNA